MRTPSPDSENHRHEVQNHIQNLLSGQRPRHPLLSQHSTRRLILEGVLEEVRIYRLKKEQGVLKAREEVARMNGQGGKEKKSLGARLGHAEEQGESSRRERRSDGRREEDREHLLTGEGRHHGQDQQDEDPVFMMTGGASGASPLGQAAAKPDHGSFVTPKAKNAYTRLRSEYPGDDSSHGKQRFDHNGKPLVRGKRGWRDASPGPFPEYEFKIGPMFGLGDHLRERFQWGVENHHLQQQRKARRERGSLDERRKVKTERPNDNNEKAERKEKRTMSKNEGKKPVKDNLASHSRGWVPSRGVLDAGLSPCDKLQHDHVDQASKGENSGQDGGDTRRRRSESRGRPDAARKAHAEADARSKAERHTRNEEESNSSPSGYRTSRSSSGKRNGKDGKSHSSTARLAPQIPVYEKTPHRQSAEACERAEAEKVKAEECDGRGTNLHEGSGTENPGHETKDVQAPQRLGTAATMDSQWWSDGSETPTDEGRHDSYDSDDERYFSDHFIEKLRSRTCSVASDPPTPHSTVPKGRKSRYQGLSSVDESRREADQTESLHKKETISQSSSISPLPRSLSSVSSTSAPGIPTSPSSRATTSSVPSDSGRSSVPEKIWAQTLARELEEQNHGVDETCKPSSLA